MEAKRPPDVSSDDELLGSGMSTRFVLRFGANPVVLPLGRTVVGRGTDCEIPLDDDLASRRHAAIDVTADGVSIEDLGSRNGVSVDGVPVARRVPLAHGSVVVIGQTRFTLLEMGRRDRPTVEGMVLPNVLAASAPADSATRAARSLGPLVFRAREALAAGARAELSTPASQLYDELRSSAYRLDPGLPYALEILARAALELAVALGDGAWLDRLFAAHDLYGRLLDRGSVHAIQAATAQLPRFDALALDEYVARLRARQPPFTGPELAEVRRIEALGDALRHLAI